MSLHPLLGIFMIIYLFCIIIATYRLLTPETCYLDLDNQTLISQQFGLLSDTLHQRNIEMSQFEHSFQDITEVEILTHKQAIKEYEKYLKYCYKINKKPWKNALSNQCYAREMNFFIVKTNYDSDFYKVCLQLSLEENEFYLPLTYMHYDNSFQLHKIANQLKSIIFK